MTAWIFGFARVCNDKFENSSTPVILALQGFGGTNYLLDNHQIYRTITYRLRLSA
jgi:hypothetical protein